MSTKMNSKVNSRAFTYLILLLDALGINVTRENCGYWWRTISNQAPLDDQIMESMIFLWSARQSMPDSTYPVEDMVEPPNKTELLSESVAVPDKNDVLKASAASPVDEPLIPLHGRYIYGIVRGKVQPLDIRGIDGQPLRIIEYGEIGAIIHSCQPSPYQSSDQDQVAGWLNQHQKVLDTALRIHESVIPMSFDVIIDGTGIDPDEVVGNWLRDHYLAAITLLDKLEGQAEYGVRVTCQLQVLEKKAEAEDPGILRLTGRIAGMSPGKAYLYKTQLASMMRAAINTVKTGLGEQIKQRLTGLNLEIKDGNTNWKPADSREILIVNLAVLADAGKVGALGDFFEECQERLQVKIQFTGPWPAYSFAANLD